MLIIYTANVRCAQERSWFVTGRNYGPDPWMTRWTLRDWDFFRRKLSEQKRNASCSPAVAEPLAGRPSSPPEEEREFLASGATRNLRRAWPIWQFEEESEPPDVGCYSSDQRLGRLRTRKKAWSER